jgi:hypothetical protein
MNYPVKENIMADKVTFILIKNKQVQTAETIDGDLAAIQRRISRIQSDGYDSTVAIFGDGSKWDFKFPMTESEVEKKSLKFYRSL